MGSGCTSCNNNKWPETRIPDTQVQYTGAAIPELGICTGDLLSEIEYVIIQKILSFLDGNSIDLSSLNLQQCTFLQQFIQISNVDKSLVNVLDVLIKAVCQLKADIDIIEDGIEDTFIYDLKCLSVSNPTTQKIVQELITQLCNHKVYIDYLTDTINNPSGTGVLTNIIREIVAQQVSASITACNASSSAITRSGTGTSFSLSINALVPPFCPIPCFADLSNFDSTGKGKSANGYCGWYICNGNNGTPDLRGYTFAGATSIPGPALLAAVDPVVLGDTDVATSIGSRKGVYKHQMLASEMPSHVHGINEPGHVHTYTKGTTKIVGDGAGSQVLGNTSTGVSTSLAFTGISILPTGGNQRHETRQPTYYGYYIMRFN